LKQGKQPFNVID